MLIINMNFYCVVIQTNNGNPLTHWITVVERVK